MTRSKPPEHNSIALSRLKPTQLTVGMLQVQHKRKRLREFERRPSELVNFILEHPVRVVLGPKGDVYVIDHHHLALALIKEKFETAPMAVEHDFSSLPLKAFWKEMRARCLVHLIDANGNRESSSKLPKNLKHLKDDPYRSLAGFVREAGGFLKMPEPFAEFLWADFYRARIKEKLLKNNFHKALEQALELAMHKDARRLPGYVNQGRK